MISLLRMLPLLLIFIGCRPEGNHKFKGSVSEVTDIIKSEKSGTGSMIPDFKWYNKKGEIQSFRQTAEDKVVVVNFWATWCLPCKMTLVALREINKKYSDKNVVVIGVSTLEPTDAAYRLDFISKFVEERSFGYQVLMDTDEKIMWSAFGMEKGGVPTLVFIKNNRIVKAFSGSQSEESLTNEIENLLN